MPAVIDPTQIQIGPAEIWYGVTKPSVGNEMTHTNADPGSGTFIGLTEGPALFRYTPEYSLEEGEQVLSTVMAFVIGENAELELTLKESTADKLRQVMQNSALVVDNVPTVKTDMLTVGGHQQVQSINTGERCVFLIAPRVGQFASAGTVQLYSYLTIYRCIVISPFEYGWDRKKGATYKATFHALSDQTRPKGDQLFQLIRERAA